MSRDVSLDIRLRPLDTKRFVGDFVRKFGAWIPAGSLVRTTRDMLQCALADLDWLDNDFKYSRKTRCWTAHGDQVINARQEDDLREFIAWCAPYVDSDQKLAPPKCIYDSLTENDIVQQKSKVKRKIMEEGSYEK